VILKNIKKEKFELSKSLDAINDWLKNAKKSKWFILFVNNNEYEYVQYFYSEYGLILDWPYNIKNSPKNFNQFLKVNTEMRKLRYKRVKRKCSKYLRYHEYGEFNTKNKNGKIFKVIRLNIEKNAYEVIELTKYLFSKIYDFENTKEILMSICLFD